MTKDTWTIIGTLAAIAVALAGIVINQNSQMNTRIDDFQARMNTRIDDFQARMSDGFSNVNERFDDMNRRFDDANQRMSEGFANVQRQIDSLQTDVRELRSMQFEATKSEPPAN